MIQDSYSGLGLDMNRFYPYLGGEWVLLEVVVLECDLRCDALGGVHDEQLLEEHEGLAVRLDPVSVHVLHERAVHVAETNRDNYSYRVFLIHLR